MIEPGDLLGRIFTSTLMSFRVVPAFFVPSNWPLLYASLFRQRDGNCELTHPVQRRHMVARQRVGRTRQRRQPRLRPSWPRAVGRRRGGAPTGESTSMTE